MALIIGGSFSLGMWFQKQMTPNGKTIEVARDSDTAFLDALKEQADSDPPYYGNSSSGNVRPQMETYIKGFVFPKNCPGTEVAVNLLKMIDQRADEESPKDYFDADNDFRAALDRFRTKVRTYAITREWPAEN